MTRFKFKVNGVDFSDVVHKYGYTTDRVPVFGKTVTTLDGVDHTRLIRTRGVLKVPLNPTSESRATEFYAELKKLPAEVEYHSFQSGADVTETMKITAMPAEFVMGTPTTNWVAGTSITFEQL